jgi:hypothetical protein
MPCFRLLGILLVLTFAVSPALSQRPIPSTPETEAQTTLDRDIQHKLQREQQKTRFGQMKRDSQKLLELATELKKYVDQAGENVLSLEVVRKADELEKLARRVKENMRGN